MLVSLCAKYALKSLDRVRSHVEEQYRIVECMPRIYRANEDVDHEVAQDGRLTVFRQYNGLPKWY